MAKVVRAVTQAGTELAGGSPQPTPRGPRPPEPGAGQQLRKRWLGRLASHMETGSVEGAPAHRQQLSHPNVRSLARMLYLHWPRASSKQCQQEIANVVCLHQAGAHAQGCAPALPAGW